jgi:hypothetical protein
VDNSHDRTFGDPKLIGDLRSSKLVLLPHIANSFIALALMGAHLYFSFFE